MTDISKGNRKHMTLSDRIIIEQGLNQQMTFKSIAASIEKDPSSISKEIRRYLLWSGEGSCSLQRQRLCPLQDLHHRYVMHVGLLQIL